MLSFLNSRYNLHVDRSIAINNEHATLTHSESVVQYHLPFFFRIILSYTYIWCSDENRERSNNGPESEHLHPRSPASASHDIENSDP